MNRIWIVGNGASLRQTPLDLLADMGEDSFGVNEIEMFYPFTRWRPTHYVRTDLNLGPWLGSTAYHILRGERTYVWQGLRTTLATLMPTKIDEVNWIRLCQEHQDTDIRDGNKRKTVWACPDVYCQFGGAIGVAMQISADLGYDEIYLVGMDLGLRGGRTHFSEDYVRYDPRSASRFLDQTLVYMHETAYESLKVRGVRVFNATVGGRLEVYPRVTIEDVINDVIVENDD